jgi:putative acetyltransferase
MSGRRRRSFSLNVLASTQKLWLATTIVGVAGGYGRFKSYLRACRLLLNSSGCANGAKMLVVMLIRAFEPGDAEALAALFHASVRQAGIRDYSAEQVAAWSPSPPEPANYVSRSQKDLIFLVAVSDEGELIGYGDLEPNGHIDHLYCRPDVVGTGVGAALYGALEVVARKSGISAVFVEASEAARRLFERKGFLVEQRNDFELNGVMIHNYQMRKLLLPMTNRP